MMTTDVKPRIYVADLAAYNAGILHGRWIDAAQDAEDIQAEVNEMLAEGAKLYGAETLSPVHEEWAIHDYEGFDGINLSEWESFDRVSELAKAIDEHGEAFGAFVSYFGIDPEDALSKFEDAYIGEMSLEDYAYEIVEECYLPQLPKGTPDIFTTYFDYEKFARDLDLGGDVVDADGYLFHGVW